MANQVEAYMVDVLEIVCDFNDYVKHKVAIDNLEQATKFKITDLGLEWRDIGEGEFEAQVWLVFNPGLIGLDRINTEFTEKLMAIIL
jgi:hypothetical protein